MKLTENESLLPIRDASPIWASFTEEERAYVLEHAKVVRFVKNEIIQTFKQVATNLCFGFSSIILAEQARVKAMCFWEETEGEKKTTL